MNYRNYEGKIVEKYGVELKGWPSSKSGICNPATLGGRQQLEILLAALESGRCHWVVLSEDELAERKKQNQAREERGEQVYRPRKSANHHSNPKNAKSAETINEEDLDDQTPTKRVRNNDEDDEDEGEQGHARKRFRTDDENGNDQDNADNAATAIGDDQGNTNDAIDQEDNTHNAAVGDDQGNANDATIDQDNTDNDIGDDQEQPICDDEDNTDNLNTAIGDEQDNSNNVVIGDDIQNTHSLNT